MDACGDALLEESAQLLVRLNQGFHPLISHSRPFD